MAGKMGATQIRRCRRCGGVMGTPTAWEVRFPLGICLDCRFSTLPRKELDTPNQSPIVGISADGPRTTVAVGGTELMTASVAVEPAYPVYGWTHASRALGISTSYLKDLAIRGVAVPSVPVAGGPQRMFSRADLERLAHAIGREIADDRPREVA